MLVTKEKGVKEFKVDLTLYDCGPMRGQITRVACQNLQKNEEKHIAFCKTCKNPISPKLRGRRKKAHPELDKQLKPIPDTLLPFDKKGTHLALRRTVNERRSAALEKLLVPDVDTGVSATEERELCPRTKRHTKGQGCASMNTRCDCLSAECPAVVQKQALVWQTKSPHHAKYYSDRITIAVNFSGHKELLEKIKEIALKELRTVPNQIILFCSKAME